MKKNLLYRSLFLSILAATCSTADAVTIDPANPNLQYSGRWDFSTPSQPKVFWQGSTLLARFDGTRISVDFKGGNGTEFFRVIVDGVASDTVIQTGRQRRTIVLAENLSPGEHTVALMKETFYTSGGTTIYGVDIDGTLLAPPAKPNFRIEFFGDSNMDGTSNYSEKDSGESGSYYAYPAMVSRMLGAEMNLQAVGGATLDNGGDGGDNDVQSFIYSPDYYNQDYAYRSGFDPHVIVVNAGANDVGAGKAEIKNRYKTVINDLRSVYGATPHIVLMNAYGWDLNEPANYSDEVVAEVGGNLSTLKFPWLWEQYHGSQWDHSGEAHMLAEHIASLNPAWSIKNANDIVDGFGRNGDVANGSFEHVAPFGGFGWRYVLDGVQRIYDPVNAADGDYYIRLNQGDMVHQPTDATGDLLPGATQGGETYTLTAKIRATSGSAVARLESHFQGQEIYTHDDDPATFQSTDVNVGSSWQTYTHTSTAAAGVWTLYSYIKATSGGIEVDDVKLSMNSQGPGNQSPTANFSASTSGLSANFTDTSSDVDGNIVQRTWNFGDGATATSINPSHSYATSGTYTVSLTVTDNEGAVDTHTQQVSVAAAGNVDLSIASASLTRGRLRVTLNWSGASGSYVDIYRNGEWIATPNNSGSYNDVANKQTATSFVYQVCDAGGSCSAEVTVNF